MYDNMLTPRNVKNEIINFFRKWRELMKQKRKCMELMINLKNKKNRHLNEY